MRRVLLVLVLVAIAVAVWLVLSPVPMNAPLSGPAPVAPVEQAPVAPGAPAKEAADAAVTETGQLAPGRIELPKPAARPDTGQRAVAVAELKPPPSRKGPVDRRGGTNPRAAHELEVLTYGFETLDEDVEACLAEWRRVEPLAPAQVMVGFEIDSNGLTRSWMEHDGGIPLGPRTCFANAVYGLDWSHVVEQPAMLTWRYELSADGG